MPGLQLSVEFSGGPRAVIKVSNREFAVQLLRHLPNGPLRHAMIRDNCTVINTAAPG